MGDSITSSLSNTFFQHFSHHSYPLPSCPPFPFIHHYLSGFLLYCQTLILKRDSLACFLSQLISWDQGIVASDSPKTTNQAISSRKLAVELQSRSSQRKRVGFCYLKSFSQKALTSVNQIIPSLRKVFQIFIDDIINEFRLTGFIPESPMLPREGLSVEDPDPPPIA